jgi:hypothetical protein
VDEADVSVEALVVLGDEELLPVICESREASIWLALLAADMARDASMAISGRIR